MSIALIAKLLHVLVGIGLVAGIVGRDVTLRRAARAGDLGAVHALLDVAMVFERIFVRPMSFLVLASGLVTAWLQGTPILGTLAGGTNWPLASLVLFIARALLVPLVFLPRGRRFEAALAAADARGSVTPELSEAFRDPMVERARVVEVVGLVVIVALMVLKPFRGPARPHPPGHEPVPARPGTSLPSACR